MKKFELVNNENLINQTCLFNSRPIVLNRDLAIILGDSDLALILQQIHYWLNINKQNAEKGLSNINTYYENRFWCFQTYDQWEEEFEWLSYNTIRNKIKKLEQLGLLISNNFNKLNIDRTKWYSIDYKKLLELQNTVLQNKLKEKENKKNKRKEQRKKATEKFKNKKNTNFSEMPKMSISRNAKNEHFEMPKLGIAIQKNNYKNNNYIQKNNIVCPSVIENKINKKEMTDRLNEQKQNFKIKIEKSDNELNNHIVDIVNDLLETKKTIIVNNKKIFIDDLIIELKKLDKNNLLKLIDYVGKKFESNNNENIKNKNKYIASIFSNTVFEKGYLLNDFNKNNKRITTNTTYNKNKFVNYDQKPLDYNLLRQIELQVLKDVMD